MEQPDITVSAPSINVAQPELNIESTQPQITHVEKPLIIEANPAELQNNQNNEESGPINVNVDVKMPHIQEAQPNPIIIDDQQPVVSGGHGHHHGSVGPIVNIHNSTNSGHHPGSNPASGQGTVQGTVANPNPVQNWGQIVHNGGHVVSHVQGHEGRMLLDSRRKGFRELFYMPMI